MNWEKQRKDRKEKDKERVEVLRRQMEADFNEERRKKIEERQGRKLEERKKKWEKRKSREEEKNEKLKKKRDKKKVRKSYKPPPPNDMTSEDDARHGKKGRGKKGKGKEVDKEGDWADFKRSDDENAERNGIKGEKKEKKDVPSSEASFDSPIPSFSHSLSLSVPSPLPSDANLVKRGNHLVPSPSKDAIRKKRKGGLTRGVGRVAEEGKQANQDESESKDKGRRHLKPPRLNFPRFCEFPIS